MLQNLVRTVLVDIVGDDFHAETVTDPAHGSTDPAGCIPSECRDIF